MTKDHKLYYGQDLNVTRYQKGKDGVERRMTLDRLPENNGEDAVAVDAKNKLECLSLVNNLGREY